LADREFRRLQLAAETGGTLGLLVRPAQARDEPSWADLRLLVEPVIRTSEPVIRTSEPAGNALKVSSGRKAAARAAEGAAAGAEADTARRLRIEILRARGGAVGRTIYGILDEQSGNLYAEANPVRVAAPLADRTARRRSTGA
jgi:hypothetical protein